MQVQGLVGGGVGEELHLVELVDPEEAPGVPSRGAGLAPEAGGGGGEPERENRLLEDLPPPHRSEGHFGGGNGPEVVPLEMVGVLLELGEMAGRHHRLGQDHGRRPHLLELVGVTVEGEGGERTEQPGAETAVEGEHGAGQLGPAFHVQEIELGADLPVGRPLGVAVGR